MSHVWEPGINFHRMDLGIGGQTCEYCEADLRVRAHRKRRVFTLNGPRLLVVRLGSCPEPDCPGHDQTVNSREEMGIAPPRLTVAWDVFAWIGHRRFARHWSVPQICAELSDSHRIDLSEDAVEDYVRRYATMVAARHTDPEQLRKAYAGAKSLVLAIDGLQPEKGHETLYVVRELTQKRVWFAEPLLSSTNDEVRQVVARARQIAEGLSIPVILWMSDKQDAFVKAIAVEFPGVAHRYCENHFLRDLAKPLLEEDSHAKVQMRRKVRGLRTIEHAVLREEAKASDSAGKQQAESSPATSESLATTTAITTPEKDRTATECPSSNRADGTESSLNASASSPADRSLPGGLPERKAISPAGQIVLDYCAAVKGILNDGQGGPLHPPGLRMADALKDVRQSVERNLGTKKGGLQRSLLSVSRHASTVG